eukprot:4838111-Amphidinium_carterae.1
MLWGLTRDKGFATLRIPHEGEVYQLLQAKTHPSLWMVVKMKDVMDNPSLTHQDLSIRVPPAKVYGLVGVFVDDLLKSGRKSLITAVTQKLKKLWKA